MTHILVYGTLRLDHRLKSLGVDKMVERDGEIFIKGSLFDLGSFPGVLLKGDTMVKCEKLKVLDPAVIRIFDQYEGCHALTGDLSSNLYNRVEYEPDTFIYEFNGRLAGSKIIHSGDWLEHRQSLESRYDRYTYA